MPCRSLSSATFLILPDPWMRAYVNDDCGDGDGGSQGRDNTREEEEVAEAGCGNCCVCLSCLACLHLGRWLVVAFSQEEDNPSPSSQEQRRTLFKDASRGFRKLPPQHNSRTINSTTGRAPKERVPAVITLLTGSALSIYSSPSRRRAIYWNLWEVFELKI